MMVGMAKTKKGDVDLSIASMTPKEVARRAAQRIQRSDQREAARAREAAVLLAHERRNRVSARSWRAAILARIVAGTDEG